MSTVFLSPDEFEEVLYRIKYDHRFRSQAKVADFMGISRQNLNAKKKRGTISVQFVEEFCQLAGIDKDKILEGLPTANKHLADIEIVRKEVENLKSSVESLTQRATDLTFQEWEWLSLFRMAYEKSPAFAQYLMDSAKERIRIEGNYESSESERLQDHRKRLERASGD